MPGGRSHSVKGCTDLHQLLVASPAMGRYNQDQPCSSRQGSPRRLDPAKQPVPVAVYSRKFAVAIREQHGRHGLMAHRSARAERQLLVVLRSGDGSRYNHKGSTRQTGRVEGSRRRPDLAVEVVSPNDSFSDVEEKALAWLVAGTQVVWIVDPQRHVTVYRDRDDIVVLDRESTLAEPNLLPAGTSVGEISSAEQRCDS